jgi:predicted DNA-binding transcriptional regulator YafY
VKVIFEKGLWDYIQRRFWYSNQKINQGTERREKTFSMTASGKEEIKTWLLSFGAKNKVLSPKFLREEIKEDISKALAFYRSQQEESVRLQKFRYSESEELTITE